MARKRGTRITLVLTDRRRESGARTGFERDHSHFPKNKTSPQCDKLNDPESDRQPSKRDPALRVRFETGRGPLGVLFGTDERPEEWALRLLRWKPKPLITRLAKGFETDSKCPSGEFLNQVNQL